SNGWLRLIALANKYGGKQEQMQYHLSIWQRKFKLQPANIIAKQLAEQRIKEKSIENIADWGLDFAIAATFIALVVPAIKKRSTLICVLVSLVSAVVFELFQVSGGLLIAALLGMTAGFVYAHCTNETGESA
ncbi:MAG: hypothetical protein MJK04_02400, partial [Psychrosphaera sp.]|nr:hypothetical protein [Psychrosphaera sp.]